MNKLVQTDGKKAFTTTLVIADAVGVEHRAVIKLLKSHDRLKTLSTLPVLKVSRGGRPIEYNILNEVQATLLVMMMRNSDRVADFKEKLALEFYRMKNRLAETISRQNDQSWLDMRKDGKKVHRKKTDTIKKFVEYATSQGSTSSFRYYNLLAKMENSSLFFLEQRFKNVREILLIRQLMIVSFADEVVEKALKDGMEKELNYKEIYILAKERVVAFANTVGRSTILSLTE